MRFALIAFLSLGVVGGYGSAIAHAAYNHHHGCDGGSGPRWGDNRWGNRWDDRFGRNDPRDQRDLRDIRELRDLRDAQPAAPAQVVPQTIVLQPQAQPQLQAPAAAPQPVFIIVPQAAYQQPVTAPAARIAAPTPASEQ